MSFIVVRRAIALSLLSGLMLATPRVSFAGHEHAPGNRVYVITAALYAGWQAFRAALSASAAPPSSAVLAALAANEQETNPATPVGHRRVREDFDVFVTPNTDRTLQGLYVLTREPFEFEPIDLGGHPISEAEFLVLLETHPQIANLALFREQDMERYAGKSEKTLGRRLRSHIAEALRDPNMRRGHAILNGSIFMRCLMANVAPQQLAEVEGWLIRWWGANLGQGLNSNQGKRKAPSSGPRRKLYLGDENSPADLNQEDIDWDDGWKA